MTASLQDVVASELERAEVTPGIGAVDNLQRYLELLHHWGRRMNLTACPEPEVVARRLLPDALVLSRSLTARTVLDVGSGSGIVGLALALLRPDLVVTLVEPNSRRCSFLRTVVHHLGLGQLTIAEARLEQLQLTPHDLAASRATWPPRQWLEHAEGLVKPGGEVVCFLTGEQQPPVAPPALELARTAPYRLADGTKRKLAFYRRFT